MEDLNDDRTVWIEHESCYGKVKSYGFTASIVVYSKDGMLYEEIMDNEEFVFITEEEM